MLQGGHHPDYGVEYYEELFSAVKQAYPQLVIHSIGPSEILHMAKVSGVSIEEAIARIKAAGLDSIAGAGAEMLPERPRKAIAPLKESGERWLEVMEIAHRLGRRVDRHDDDGHRRDQRRADRAPADDPRRAGPHRRLPGLHPVDVPAGEQPPQGPHPGDHAGVPAAGRGGPALLRQRRRTCRRPG